MENIFRLKEEMENSTHIKVSGVVNEEKVWGDLGVFDEEENFQSVYPQAVIEKENIIDYVEVEE